MGAPKQKWTEDEEAALKAGVVKHGAGKWRTILKDPEFSGVLYFRSNVDLKDKWRNMGVMANEWGSREKARLALKRMQQVPKQEQNDMDISGDEDAEDVKPGADFCGTIQIAGTKKSILRLDDLIMEAITSLNQPGGSNKTNIGAFIEEQYWAPPNFRRILSAKLKLMTDNGRLLKVKRKYKVPSTPALPGRRRNTSMSLWERRQITSPKVEKVGLGALTKSQFDLELVDMMTMTPEEAEAVAARAVAEAEVAIEEAEDAARDAEAAEAKAQALQAVAIAARKKLNERNLPKMMMIRP